MAIVEGTEVEAYGLQSMQDLNGEWGTVEEMKTMSDGAPGAMVMFDDPHGAKVLRLTNLRVVPIVVKGLVEAREVAECGHEEDLEGKEGVVLSIEGDVAVVNFGDEDGDDNREMPTKNLRPVKGEFFSNVAELYGGGDDGDDQALGTPSQGPAAGLQTPEAADLDPEVARAAAEAKAAAEAEAAAAAEERARQQRQAAEDAAAREREEGAEGAARGGIGAEEGSAWGAVQGAAATSRAAAAARQQEREAAEAAQRAAATAAVQAEEGADRARVDGEWQRVGQVLQSREAEEREASRVKALQQDSDLQESLQIIQRRRKEQELAWRRADERRQAEEADRLRRKEEEAERERQQERKRQERERQLAEMRLAAGRASGQATAGYGPGEADPERNDRVASAQANVYFGAGAECEAGMIGKLVTASAQWWRGTQQTWVGALDDPTRGLHAVLCRAEQTAADAKVSGLRGYVAAAARCRERHSTWISLQRVLWSGTGPQRHPDDRASAMQMAAHAAEKCLTLQEGQRSYRVELAALRADAEVALATVGSLAAAPDDGTPRPPQDVAEALSCVAPFADSVYCEQRAQELFHETCTPDPAVSIPPARVAATLKRLQECIDDTLEHDKPPGPGVAVAMALPDAVTTTVHGLTGAINDLGDAHNTYSRSIREAAVRDVRELRRCLDLVLWAAQDADASLEEERARVKRYGEHAPPDADGLASLFESGAKLGLEVAQLDVALAHSEDTSEQAGKLRQARGSLCAIQTQLRERVSAVRDACELYPELQQITGSTPQLLRIFQKLVNVGLALPEYRFEEFAVDNDMTEDMREGGRGRHHVFAARHGTGGGEQSTSITPRGAQVVVLKQQSVGDSEQHLFRWVHGCKTLTSLGDAFVATPRGIVTKRGRGDKDEVYFMIDYKEGGGNLMAKLVEHEQKEDEPFGKIAPYIVALFRSLAECHALRLPHGALHPGNVLLKNDDGQTAALVDFDLAQSSEADASPANSPLGSPTTRSRMSMAAGVHAPPGIPHEPRIWQARLAKAKGAGRGDIGHAAFASPEALSRRVRSTESDMWSAGLILLEALRGTLNLDGSADIDSDAPASVQDLCRRMLSDDPGDRPSAAHALEELARAVLGAEDAAATVARAAALRDALRVLHPSQWGVPPTRTGPETPPVPPRSVDVTEAAQASAARLLGKPHADLRSVQRNEQPRLWQHYAAVMLQPDPAAQPAPPPAQRDGYFDTQLLAGGRERWLTLHTALTPLAAAEAFANGLDPTAVPWGPFGRGCVFVESPAECDAGPAPAGQDEYIVLLCRVVTGAPHALGDLQTAPRTTSPPPGCGCVLATMEGGQQRRWIVYDAARIYPAFAMHCKRPAE